ncbi:TauD/TfdA family dioxygenase [Pacificispira sp.]|uniref:TauD/TfdA family dioxygenase n=1 Tax=Pacificispira sp. TaxID=2888761 RepID=UPI003BAD0B8F
MQTLNAAAIASVTKNGSGLQVDWVDGDRSTFHYIWLRDCCYCEVCGDCHSSLRRYIPSLESIAIKPASVAWDTDKIVVEWEGDGHVSTFAANWLNENRYDDRARLARRQPVIHWDASTDLCDLTFDFDKVRSGATEKLALQRHLISHGIVVVTNGPREPGCVTEFAELFGEVSQSAYGAVFDLRPSNTIGTAGTTFRDVPPHSDEAFVYSPPGIEALACIHPADDGGDSIMVDGFGIAEKLRRDHPKSFHLLSAWNHHFVRLHPGKLDQRAYAPVIALDDDGEISGTRLHTRASGPPDLPESVMEDYLVAYHRLCAMMMAPENQIRIRLKAGEAVVFDNHRALHARSAFSDPRRFMQICAVTRERFHQNFRLLATELGDPRSANLVLRAGACR